MLGIASLTLQDDIRCSNRHLELAPPFQEMPSNKQAMIQAH
jgi:hypothetical protein